MPVVLIALGVSVAAAGWGRWYHYLLWAFGSWHILRQNVGLLKVYSRLHGASDAGSERFDVLCYYVCIFSGLGRDYLVGSALEWPRLERLVDIELASTYLQGVFWLGVVALLGNQVRVARRGGFGLPKALFAGATLAISYVTYFVVRAPLNLQTAVETAYHDVQYQGWIQHYQRKRFSSIRRVVMRWFVITLCFGLAVGSVEVLSVLQHLGWAQYVLEGYFAVVLYHYYIDGVIWRFSKSRELDVVLARSSA